MREVGIRSAGPQDGAVWLSMFERVAAEGRWLGAELPVDAKRFLDGIVDWARDDRRDVLFATIDGEPVGWINLRLEDGQVDLGMGVLEELRGAGVGTALLTAAVEWAEDHGADGLRLEVFPHNEAAIRLYRKFRFAEVERRIGAHPRTSGEIWDGIVMARPLRVDWGAWHDDYADPDSNLSRRLRCVQGHIRQFLDGAAPGVVRVISMCAGEGRDLLEVLAAHPRAGDVRARLVELDSGNAAMARAAISALDLAVEVREQDAGATDAYDGAVPAELVLVCGVFGNVPVEDIENTVRRLRSLCAPGATVIWTRHPRRHGVYDAICGWFEDEGFHLVSRDVPDDDAYGVGVHRLAAEPRAFVEGQHLFRFV